MKLIRQPPGSSVCGQSCVATLLGITLEEAIALVGKTGATDVGDLRKTLLSQDVFCGVVQVSPNWRDEQTAVLFWESVIGENAHWTVWHKRKFYDPSCGVFRKKPRRLENSFVTSYFRVAYNEA